MKPLPKLPDIDTLKEIYDRTGSIRKASRELQVAESCIRQAFRAANIKVVNYGKTQHHKCDDCANATALRCAFMRASINRAESVLQEAGVKYAAKVQRYKFGAGTRTVRLLKVVRCPKYKQGSVAI